jgi:GT2 family glycosyltransferase
MKYSIVVISKDRHAWLLDVLGQLKEIEANPQIVVVEAIDNPGPLEIDGIDYVPIPTKEAGFSNQRNLGVARARGEYVIFVDDDLEIQPGWYTNLTKVIDENSDISGVMGAVFPLKPTIIGFCEGVLGHPGGGFRLHHQANGRLLPLSQVATCNTIIKKSVIEEAGGFDLKNKFGSEDSDLTIRITNQFGPHQFRYVPSALVYHMPRNKFRRIIPWYIRRGKADADLFLKHTTHIRYLIGTSVLLKIIPCVLLSLFLNNAWILTGVFVAWYFLQLTRSRFLFKYFKYYDFPAAKRLIIFFIFPAVKLTADLMFDLGRIIRFLNQK